MVTSGIYKITNIINNKLYFGSAKNFQKRWNEHKNALKRNKHPNKHLQDAYNKYGEHSFIYSIIIYCDISDLLLFEQRFIDTYWDGGLNCYNISKNVVAAMEGRKQSEETKLKISAATKGKLKSKETKERMSKAWLGHKLSEESKQKISAANSGINHPRFGKHISEQNRLNILAATQGEASYKAKLNNEQVIEIFKSKEMGTVLAKRYNVGTTIISQIRHGKRWKHITGELLNE